MKLVVVYALHLDIAMFKCSNVLIDSPTKKWIWWVIKWRFSSGWKTAWWPLLETVKTQFLSFCELWIFPHVEAWFHISSIKFFTRKTKSYSLGCFIMSLFKFLHRKLFKSSFLRLDFFLRLLVCCKHSCYGILLCPRKQCFSGWYNHWGNYCCCSIGCINWYNSTSCYWSWRG